MMHRVACFTTSSSHRLVFLLCLALAYPFSALAQLPLRQDDVVCLIGNGLADRMQHDGWMETLIQSRMVGKKLTFRNCAVAGDTVTSRPRSKGVPTVEDYLARCKADVVFVFFGYNESFGGEAKLGQFKSDLTDMVGKYLNSKFNGECAPRVVLFSPIAHENLGDPQLPDGRVSNANLALYTDAIKQVAQDNGVTFIDLFIPSKELYAKAESPLTMNGIHLLPEGYRQLGEIIASAVIGAKVASTPAMEALRQAVLDKDWHWHNRFRAMDENNIWGTRSGLRFVKGQTNREVLEHELVMLDVMTSNRDAKIHAVAQGRSFEVDDSNVPKPVEVISNLSGENNSLNAKKEGGAHYLSGKESLAKLRVQEGFSVNLFADESMFPALANPVQLQVDTKGRLWAACWSTYPKWEPLKQMTDSLLILPDENHDGVADKAIEFAKVHNPLGFAFWGGGVIVASQPDILFLKDTDGDDKADIRLVLLQATGSADTHHAANNFMIGPDGGLYWQSGVFLRHNYEHPWGPSLATPESGMYRFDPRRFTISFIAANGPNPHGNSFDRWGYLFATDGTSGRARQVRPHGEGFKMFPLLTQQSRPVPASTILSSANFPDDHQQDFFICNVIGYLGIYRYDLHRDGYTEGKTNYKPGEIWGTPTPDFLRSDDQNFRPSDARVGSDGALYIADWQNAIIGHMQHNMRDPSRDNKHGRIFRMIYKDRPLQKPVAIDGQTVTVLLDVLKHPIDGVRERARIELSEHNPEEVETAVRQWIKQFDPKKAEHAHPLLEALWLFQRLNIREQELLKSLLDSPEKHARMAAATVKHFWGPADPTKGKTLSATTVNEEKLQFEVPPHLTGSAAEAYRRGAEIYHRDAHCATCHQPHGKGLDSVYPPLAGSSWVSGSDERLIKLTLNGLWGQIEVNGKVYDPAKGVPPMTPFEALLKDAEVADVLTYVRNSWGNKAAPVKPESVSKVRAANKDRTVFWKPEELLRDHPMENSDPTP